MGIRVWESGRGVAFTKTGVKNLCGITGLARKRVEKTQTGILEVWLSRIQV